MSVQVCKQSYVKTIPTPTPALTGMIPEVREIIPMLVGIIPKVRGIIPRVWGIIPRVWGIIPVVRGIIPRLTGIIPAQAGMIPNVGGIILLMHTDYRDDPCLFRFGLVYRGMIPTFSDLGWFAEGWSLPFQIWIGLQRDDPSDPD